MAGGGRVLRSLDGPLAPVGVGRGSSSRPTLVYKTGPNMRAAHENARQPRPDLDDVDEVIGASRLSNFRFKIERVARKRRVGLALVALLYAGTGVVGVIDGGHWPSIQYELERLHITTANALGFRVASVQTEGQNALTDDEVLLALGVKDDTALPFLDVKKARDRLLENPLVKDAAVRKLYPDRVTVDLVERNPFALWQHDGKVQILAEDGAVIDDFHDSRFAHLPLVVGEDADKKARELLDALDNAPKVREQTYAAVLVAERRWNLRLRSGVEVKLPETDFSAALARLEVLQEQQNIFGKWISVIDLRSAAHTVVQLTPEAAAKLADDDKNAAKTKKKGGQT